MTAAQRLAEWTGCLQLDEVPTEVAEAAKLHLLDTLGCGLAAAALGIAAEGRETMAELGGEAQATVIGRPGLPAPNAAFANAMLCHGLDFDDTHSDSIAHVSVVTCPAALAVAEAGGASGRDALAAIVAANEVVTRVGMAATGRFHARGFHPTAVCGIFGATTAAARLGGLGAERAASALGIAGSLASGLFAYLEDGTATKPIHPGWAAHGGLVAARLAAHGASGPPSIFEGKFGLYHAFLGAGKDEVDLDAQLADLGTRWETPRIAFKPYPACHFMHGAVGATAEAGAGGLRPEDVDEIVVTVPAAGVDLVLEPADKKVAPRTTYEAKFSLQYSAAAMVVHGRCGVTTYADEAIRDPEVLELAERVRYETKDYPTYPAAFPGGVRITTRDGRTLEADLPHQRGGPENPMTAGEVREKYRENAGLALGPEAVEVLEEAVIALEEQEDLRAALAPLSAAARERAPA
ncbi:MAG: MmgE/PrpD family protein [Gaiellaceae bacterium]